MTRLSIDRRIRGAFLCSVFCGAAFTLSSCSAPWALGDWPDTSHLAVTVLDHPTIESVMERSDPGVDAGYQFVAFGDQRALADGEWQSIMKAIAKLTGTNERLLFMVDTGDIVGNGTHSDQFVKLNQILSAVPDLPYLVGVGNHEKHNNRGEIARVNTAMFLDYVDEAFTDSRMYYRKDVGPVRFLMLDTSDFVYGDDGHASGVGIESGSRGEKQMRWLVDQLSPENRRDDATTIVVLHHPFVQTSTRYRSSSAKLWAMEWDGRTLPDILVDGGVDIVLAGHTHTYERFRIRRDDGNEMMLVNLSGRPRPSRIVWARSPRRAHDIRGDESSWFADKGWTGMDRWTITQEDAMVEDESNQFGLFTVEPGGGILLQIFYLDDDAPGGVRHDEPVRLR